jgi:arylsulfatase A-like enzyme
MRRRTLLRTLLAAPLAAAAQTSGRKPNLVILFADDLGYGDIGCYGSPDVPTPHIDSIARNGVRFTDGYVSCAVCSPSRAALLTGRHQQRFGHEFNSGPPEREAQVGFGLPASAKIAPAFLKPAGYRSKIIGKWHLGVRPGYHPMDRGFDEFYGFLTGANAFVTVKTPGARTVETEDKNGAIPAKRDKPIYRNRTPVEEDRYLTDAFAEEAVEFIGRNKQQPFLLYLAFNAVHTPLHATDTYLARFKGISDERHRLLAAMTSSMDDAVGRVLAKLRESGLEKDTLVVFLSDNGCPEITRAGTNGPLNGEKVTYYEGGIRVPFVMQWPGRIPAGKVYREPVVSRDILPTFLTAANVKADVTFDGVDLLPFLNGQRGQAVPHEALFWRSGKARVVRKGNWKLLELGDQHVKLFDLSKDIGEHDSVAAKHPQIVKELRTLFAQWEKGMKAPAWPARYRELVVNGEKWNWEL